MDLNYSRVDVFIWIDLIDIEHFFEKVELIEILMNKFDFVCGVQNAINLNEK